jgi:DNA-binding PadR family transcriptional regulator
MTEAVDPRFEAELRRGAIQLVALHFLETPRYGYDLVRLLAAAGFTVEEGTLYPILRRFEKAGVLTSRWDTAGARPRKYYELSDRGREVKQGMRDAWERARDATDAALLRSMNQDGEPAGEGGPGTEGSS